MNDRILCMKHDGYKELSDLDENDSPVLVRFQVRDF